MIARSLDCFRWEIGVHGFEFLKAHNVGRGLAEPVQQVFSKRRLMSLILKLAIFIGSASGELSTQTGKSPREIRFDLFVDCVWAP